MPQGQVPGYPPPADMPDSHSSHGINSDNINCLQLQDTNIIHKFGRNVIDSKNDQSDSATQVISTRQSKQSANSLQPKVMIFYGK